MPKPYQEYRATIYEQINAFPKPYESSIYKMGAQQVKDVKKGFKITEAKKEEKKTERKKAQVEKDMQDKKVTMIKGPAEEQTKNKVLVASSIGSMQRTLAIFDFNSREATPYSSSNT